MNAAKRKPVWVAVSDQEYEGGSVIGVFPTAIQAMRALDKEWPMPTPAKKFEWAGAGGEYTRRTGNPGEWFTVTRFKLGVIGG